MSTDVDLQSIAETHERPFLIIDQDFRIVAANQAFLLTHGASLGDVLHRHCWEVTHNSTRPCHELGEECPNQYIQQTGRPHACLHAHAHCDADRRLRHMRVKGFPLRLGDGRRYYAELFEELAPGRQADGDAPLMLGSSKAFLASLDAMQVAARSEAPVLIQGETGVGKELAAQFVHRNSARADHPLLTLDCTLLSDGLAESELFGHARGAYTGSVGERAGLFKLADGGSLFLDEIGELPKALQVKLLRVLESGELRRVGSDRSIRTDVRIICATNRDLAQEMMSGNFRADLYYRLACLSVRLPSLRERAEDIPALANHLLGHMPGVAPRRLYLTDEAMQALMTHNYPGNVRELRNLLQAAAARVTGTVLDRDSIERTLREHPAAITGAAQPPDEDAAHAGLSSRISTLHPEDGRGGSMQALEREHLRRLLACHDGDRAAMAEALGVSVRTVYRKLKRHALR